MFLILLAVRIGPYSVQADEGTGLKTYLPIISRYLPPEWLGPTGGSIINIVADRRNPAVLYAGAVGGGVYKSTNGGDSWFWSGRGIGSVSVYTLAIDPQNSSIVYAGSYGKGVYKTTDAGKNWTQVGRGTITGSIVYTLDVNPGNHNIIYAGTRLPGTYSGNYVGYLFKSVDGGTNWSSVFSVTNDWMYDIAINPNSPETILAAAHEHGLYRSTTYGGSGEWSHVDLGGGEYDKGRALAFDPRSWTGRAYYAAWHGDLLVSTSNGQTWTYSSQGMGTTHVYPNGIEIRPGQPDSIFLAAHSSDVAGVLHSSDAGASWHAAGLSGKTVYTVAAPAGTSSLIAGTYLQGMYKSTNDGDSWRSTMSGVDNVQVTGIVVLDDETIFCSTISKGVMRSVDGGKSWTAFNNNLGSTDVNGLVQSPSKPEVIYALTASAGLRTINLGSSTSWSAVAIPAPAGMVTEPALVPLSPFARPEPLDELNKLEHVSEEGDGLAPGSTSEVVAAGTEGVNTLTFAPSQPAYAYLGTNGSGVYISPNGGVSWRAAGLNGAVVRQVVISPTDPAMIYALTSEPGRVWYSDNSGGTWHSLTLPNSQLTAFAASYWPGDSARIIFGTTNGAWMYS
ncbi:MAG: hypothetical protein JW730_05820, partial [Anaerolineales bacterium]|nr:hypothetical protein [Anaerolineales bacterium]